LKSMLAESDSGDNYFASMRKSSSSAGMVKINARAEPYYMRDTPR